MKKTLNGISNIQNYPILRTMFIAGSFLLQLIVYSNVVQRTVNNLSLQIWLLSMFFLYLVFPFFASKVPDLKYAPEKPEKKTFIKFFSITVIMVGLVLRILPMLNTYIFHTDEYLSSFFSYSLGDLTKIDWFGVFPAKGVWVCQFPVLYFFIQKIFFNLLGVGTFAMRMSVIPYIVVVLVFTYLIARELYGEKIAFITIAIFSFFSPDLYLARWALHFISSTAFFLVATYLFIRSYKYGKKIYFGLLGIFLGFCYMTYYSSYIAFPLLLLYLLALTFKKQINKKVLFNFILSFGIFLFSISPYIAYATKVDNFYTQRTEQVKLINGLWSPYKIENPTLSDKLDVYKTQLKLSVKGLYTDNIGGQGGYFFGKFALFDKFTNLMLLFSLAYFVMRILIKREPDKVFLLISIFFTFLTGVVFTMPPPAFHRMSIIFPFISLIMAVTLYDGYLWLKPKFGSVSTFVIFTAVITFIFLGNTLQFTKILKTEETDNPDYPVIEDYLNFNGKTKVYIAAFDSYGLNHWLFVRSGGRITSETKSLNLLLEDIEPGKSTPLVVLYPDENTLNIVREKYPNAEVIGRYIWHMLLTVN